MTISLSPEQEQALTETRRLDSPDELRALLKADEAEIARLVREEQEPSQRLDATLTALRDLYRATGEHAARLEAAGYGPERRAFFRDAIRLLDTVSLWFREGTRTGSFRPRTVTQLLAAARPWRERLKKLGAHAFVFEPDVAEPLAKANGSGTLAEEREDLVVLTALVKRHHERLRKVGMPEDFLQRGEALRDEAAGRDLLAIFGIRSQDEAIGLRNRIATYATLLGREARAAGVNACADDPKATEHFEGVSLRNATRRLRTRRSGKR